MQENFDLKELMELLDTMQLRLLKEKLIEMNEVDIAAFIEELDSEKTVVVPHASQGAGKRCVRLPACGEAGAYYQQHHGL